MPATCAAPGCAAAPARADVYCPAHRTRLRRYGHPLQRPVTARDFAPFACRIAARLPQAGEVRSILATRWGGLLEVVEAVQSTGTFRVPFGLPITDRRATSVEREAARLFLATARTATVDAVADLVIGLAMLRAVEPATFEDETAFRFLLARRFLGLSPENAIRDRRSGSTTWRTFPAGLTLTIAEWLWSAFGEVAETMAEREATEIAEAHAEKARLARALASLGTTAVAP